MRTHIIELITLKQDAEALGSQWNGEDSGKLEEQAHICGEIVDLVNKTITLLEELNEN